MVENVIRLIRELDEQIDELKHTAGEDITKLEEQLKAVENAITELENTNVSVPDDLFQLRDHFREHRKEITNSKEALQTLKTELLALLDKFDSVAETEPEDEMAEEPVETEESTEPSQQNQMPNFEAEKEEPVETEESTEPSQQNQIPDFEAEKEEPVKTEESTELSQQDQMPDFEEEFKGNSDTIPEKEQPEPDEFHKTDSDTKPKSLREILSSSPSSTSDSKIIRINEQVKDKQFVSSSETEGSNQSTDTTSSDELRRVLLEILNDREGRATSNDIRTEMEQRLGSSFTPADLDRLPNGKLTWWRNVQLERERLIEEGILSSEYHQGMWELN